MTTIPEITITKPPNLNLTQSSKTKKIKEKKNLLNISHSIKIVESITFKSNAQNINKPPTILITNPSLLVKIIPRIT